MRLSSLRYYFYGYFAWLSLFFLIIYLWKLSGVGWLSGISDHLSNFSLRGLLSLLIIGPRAFVSKVGRTKVFAVAAIFILANLAVEIIAEGTLGGFNVLDGYDALYGILASAIIICTHLLLATRKGRV